MLIDENYFMNNPNRDVIIEHFLPEFLIFLEKYSSFLLYVESQASFFSCAPSNIGGSLLLYVKSHASFFSCAPSNIGGSLNEIKEFENQLKRIIQEFNKEEDPEVQEPGISLCL